LPRLVFIARSVVTLSIPPFIIPDAERFSGKVILAGNVRFGKNERISFLED